MAILTSGQCDSFKEDGYLFVRALLDSEEVGLLSEAVARDNVMTQSAMDVCDSEGRKTNLSLWNHPGDDIYGAIARSHRLVGAMEQLLCDEVYHYHSKLSAKQPRVGGAWEWHQDYGYWYDNGCLYPDMASVVIAIDANTRENGCMQVLRGSQSLGRIDHGRYGEQTGADPERVEAAIARMELVYCEMRPGDALFFHSNLLHCSEPNLSERQRWNLICCYNTRHNDPYRQSHHPGFTALEQLPDSAIKELGARVSSANQSFLRQEDDETTG